MGFNVDSNGNFEWSTELLDYSLMYFKKIIYIN